MVTRSTLVLLNKNSFKASGFTKFLNDSGGLLGILGNINIKRRKGSHGPRLQIGRPVLFRFIFIFLILPSKYPFLKGFFVNFFALGHLRKYKGAPVG